MTAMNPNTVARIGSRANPDSAHGQGDACRRLWASVVLHALNDWWQQAAKAKGNRAAIARIRADALRYFRSRDGREVLALAGLDADPETLADAAIDPAAKCRMMAAYGGAQ